MPNQRVVAICVVQDGADTVGRTLTALKAQRRPIDRLIVVNLSSNDESRAIIESERPDDLLELPRNTTFGDGIAAAVSHYIQGQTLALGEVAETEIRSTDWFWLLSQDNAPEEFALRTMLREAELSPSVTIIGPKLVRAQDQHQLVEFGQTLTTTGTTVHLSAGQLDQGQFDKRSDVMGVAATGMLISAAAWLDHEGLNPALPNVDGGLDLSIRARLAGARVVVSPEARVEYSRQHNLLSPDGNPIRAIRRALLMRRMSYLSPILLPFAWLLLLPEAIIRSILLLLNKQPGRVVPEFIAAFNVFISLGQMTASRKLFRKKKQHPMRSLDLLRRSLSENRRMNLTDDDARTPHTEPVQFFFGGGGLTTLILFGFGIIAFGSFWGANHLFGGGLSPLAPIAELWQNAIWRPDLLENPGDPFHTVLAMIGSLTFWDTSQSLIVLYLIALPLAGVGAWFLAARLGAGQLTRALVAVLWALAPMHLSALADGRLPAIVFHLVLPWLALAARHAARNWTAAGFAALLFFVAAASQPAMLPILFVVWLVLLALNVRYFFRLIVIPIPAALFFLPLALLRFSEGNIFALLTEPSTSVAFKAAKVWELALGMPQAGLGGWVNWLDFLGNPVFVSGIILAAALAPFGLTAIFSLATKRFLPAAVGLLIALTGFVWAFLLAQFTVSYGGAILSGIWPGGALSFYWLGLIIAVTMAFQTRKVGAFQVLTVVAATAAMLPLLTASLFGNALIGPNARVLPALVTAVADGEPNVGTLEIRPQQDGAIAVTVQRGIGTRIDQFSTVNVPGQVPDAFLSQEEINQIAVNFLSGVDEGAERLVEAGVHYILLRPVQTGPAGFALGSTPISDEASGLREQYLVGLGSVFELTQIGDTSEGKLWVLDTEATSPPDIPSTPLPEKVQGDDRNFALLLISVLLLVAIFSIPTRRLTPLGTAASRRGKSAEVDDPIVANEDSETKKWDKKTLTTGVVQGISRSLLALTALAAVAVTIVGSSFVTLPVFALHEASAEAVHPASATGQMVCPGSFLTPRLVAGEQGYVSLGGPVTGQTVAEGWQEHSIDRGNLPGTPPVSISPESNLFNAGPATSGAVVQQLNDNRARGLVAATCVTPTTEGYVLAGTLTTGNAPVLYLINPNPVSVTLELSYFSEHGRQASHQVSIPANTQMMEAVAGFLPDSRLAGVQFMSNGGPVAVYLGDTSTNGLESGGTSFVSAATGPALGHVFPGLQLSDQVAILSKSLHEGKRDLLPTVRLMNPGEETLNAQVEIWKHGSPGPDGVTNTHLGQVKSVSVNPGVVDEVVFEGLDDGEYSARIVSDQPVFASVRISTITQTSDDPDSEEFRSDFDWMNSSAPHTGNRRVAVPDGPNPILSLMNTGNDEVSVNVQGYGTVLLSPGVAVDLSVRPGVIDVDGLDRTAISLRFSSDRGHAGINIPTNRPPGESIWVY